MCCFFTALVFFGPRLGFLVYWLLVPLKVSAAFANFNLPLAGEPAGLDLRPLDSLDVRDRLPLEQLGLDLARVWCDGRRRQLRGRLSQTPAGAGVSGQRSTRELLIFTTKRMTVTPQVIVTHFRKEKPNVLRSSRFSCLGVQE